MTNRDKRGVISFGFSCFCVGAMMCEMLMFSGVKTIALHLGVPAFVLTSIARYLLRDKKPKEPMTDK